MSDKILAWVSFQKREWNVFCELHRTVKPAISQPLTFHYLFHNSAILYKINVIYCVANLSLCPSVVALRLTREMSPAAYSKGWTVLPKVRGSVATRCFDKQVWLFCGGRLSLVNSEITRSQVRSTPPDPFSLRQSQSLLWLWGLTP